MKNAGLDEAQAGIKIARRNIHNLRYVDVTGDRSKVRCCKEQYCIGTSNVRSMIKANWKWSKGR